MQIITTREPCRTLKKKRSFSQSPVKFKKNKNGPNCEEKESVKEDVMEIEKIEMPEDENIQMIFKWLEEENIQWVSPLDKKEAFFAVRRQSVFLQRNSSDFLNLSVRRSSFSIDSKLFNNRRSRNSVLCVSGESKQNENFIGISKNLEKIQNFDIDEKSGSDSSDSSDNSSEI